MRLAQLVLLGLCFVTLAGNAQLKNDTLNGSNREVNVSLSLRFSDFGSNRNYFHKSAKDFGRVITAPLHWNKSSYLIFSAVIAGGATLYVFDEEIYNLVARGRNSSTEFASTYLFEPLGNYTTYTLLTGMACYGLIFKKERPTTTALLSIESLLITSVVTLIPKTVTGRVRPLHTDPLSASEWNGPFGGKSFWSGHTAAAFSVASVIAGMYSDKPVIPITAYALATLTGLSRIHDEKHWPSDVFFGAVAGITIGKLVVKSYRSDVLTCMPLLTPNSQGVYISCSF